MAEKTLLVTLRVTVSDLSDAERQRHAKEMRVPVSELEALADVSAGRLGVMIAEALECKPVQEIVFEGSDEFCKLTAAVVDSVGWEPDDCEGPNAPESVPEELKLDD